MTAQQEPQRDPGSSGSSALEASPTMQRMLTVIFGLLSWLSSTELADAQQGWPSEVTRGPFRFHASFPLQPHISLFEELAALPEQVTETLGIGAPQEMVDVYLFANREIYELYMRQYFPNVSARRAMFIKVSGPGNVFAYLDAGFDVDLRHECTHAILHASLPMVPLWLDEGLAEYFEVPLSQRANDNPHLSELHRHLRWRGIAPLEHLEGIAKLEEMGADQYRDAWGWVHLMLHGPSEARAILRAFMADVNQHRPPDKISARFAAQGLNPSKMFAAHFGQKRTWLMGRNR